MTARNPPIQWRAIVRGIAIVYGITFAAGLVFAFNGITPQTDRVMYPFLALLAGAVGVAVALRVADTTRPAYLVAMGLGVWLLSATSVLLGAQSFTGWLDSSTFIATTVILGRLFLGTSLEHVPTSVRSQERLVTRHSSYLHTHRTKQASL